MSRNLRGTCARLAMASLVFGLAVGVAPGSADHLGGGPVRLLDTRPGTATVDGIGVGSGLVPAGGVVVVPIAGRPGVGPGATAIVNLTVTDPQSDGFLTLYPCSQSRPNTSNLNFAAGQTVANLAASPIGGDGSVCIYSSATTHVVADYARSSSAFQALPNPVRLLDSRPGARTVDGQSAGIGARPAGSTTEVRITGRVDIPFGGQSAWLNVTVIQPASGGFVTVFACGLPRPNTSNLNFAAGQTVAGAVLARLPFSGRVCLFTSTTAHLVVDTAGTYSSTVGFVPLDTPLRLLDTRSFGTTFDGAYAAVGAIGAGGVLELPIAGRAPAAANALYAVLNITATESETEGFVTAFPCGHTPPNASNVNYRRGQTVANLAIVPMSASGRVCLFSSAPVHIIADTFGSVFATSGLDA